MKRFTLQWKLRRRDGWDSVSHLTDKCQDRTLLLHGLMERRHTFMSVKHITCNSTWYITAMYMYFTATYLCMYTGPICRTSLFTYSWSNAGLVSNFSCNPWWIYRIRILSKLYNLWQWKSRLGHSGKLIQTNHSEIFKQYYIRVGWNITYCLQLE